MAPQQKKTALPKKIAAKKTSPKKIAPKKSSPKKAALKKKIASKRSAKIGESMAKKKDSAKGKKKTMSKSAEERAARAARRSLAKEAPAVKEPLSKRARLDSSSCDLSNLLTTSAPVRHIFAASGSRQLPKEAQVYFSPVQ